MRTGLHLMTSASGVATARPRSRPVNLLMSGPVAGVVGSIWVGKRTGYDSVLTSGTSADIGLAQDRRLRMKHLLDTKVGPYRAPSRGRRGDRTAAARSYHVDPGSIASATLGRAARPAAYGRGGAEATATDALVNPAGSCPRTSWAAAGARPGIARQAFERTGAGLGMSVEEASMGAIQILCH